MSGIVQALMERGVIIPHPASVDVDPALRPEHVAAGVEIHAGCRVRGARTSIGPGCILGAEAPMTIDDCRLGRGVVLGGGYASGAVFLDESALYSGAHVRPGTILEEQVSGGHTVGLKQTILFPFVTTGSLINFCDVLMAGGTGPQDHGEVGSSYVHFNFTPHGDKATASLIGDVPRGVMLDQPPAFLGGQGGLVGPARVAFGTVIAAGVVHRGDILESGHLIRHQPVNSAPPRPYPAAVYGNIARVVTCGLAYIGNLMALQSWYTHVRALFLNGDAFSRACLEGARGCIEQDRKERIKQLGRVAAHMPASLAAARAERDHQPDEERWLVQARFAEAWPAIEAVLLEPDEETPGQRDRDRFLAGLTARIGPSYLDTIRGLPPELRKQGTAWLQARVDSITRLWPPRET